MSFSCSKRFVLGGVSVPMRPCSCFRRLGCWLGSGFQVNISELIVPDTAFQVNINELIVPDTIFLVNIGELIIPDTVLQVNIIKLIVPDTASK